jgi:small-conductance mechanosensitive channel
MNEEFNVAVPLAQAPDGAKKSVEDLATNVVRLVGFLWEWITGVPERAEQAILYREIWLYGATSAVLFVLVLAVCPTIFSFLRRRVERRRKEKGDDDAWVLVLEAISKPLELTVWLYGIFFSALPLLLLLHPNHFLFPIRVLFEKIFELGLFVALYWFFFRCVYAGEALLRRWARAPKGGFQDLVIELAGKTLRVVIPLAGVISALQLVELPRAYNTVIDKTSSLLIIGAVSWLLFQLVDATERWVLSRHDLTGAGNLRARQIHTQVQILKRTLHVIIVVFSVASALMLFDQVRHLGMSVLASAGVLGLVIGFAAQRTIANLFAGFQLALTQPIRIEDVVIVENEWGRVEEVTLTYVVVRIWDMRRLIVPLSYFIERAFQNWTRRDTDIVGTVFIYTDYTIPVEEVREELKRIVAQSRDWDGNVCVLQVTNATERTLELRALASASDASKSWDLRCEIREKLVAFVQKNYPASLPRIRAELEPRASKIKPPAES